MRFAIIKSTAFSGEIHLGFVHESFIWASKAQCSTRLVNSYYLIKSVQRWGCHSHNILCSQRHDEAAHK